MSTKRKNKHGRIGARKRMSHAARHNRRAAGAPVYDASSEAYRQGWQAGLVQGQWEGRQLESMDTLDFLKMLLTKRNAKDIKGLIEKRIG